ncbi:MAG: restriction endonuclease, partial [Vitreoscilla sp.]|nr:restriction endonuclease [Vitreoscilla sp.]
MASQKSRPRPQDEGLRPLAIKLLVAGILMAALPWALARATGVSSGGPLRAVANLGWLLSVLAGLIYLVGAGTGRHAGSQPGGERNSTHPSGAGASRISTQPPASRFSPSSRMSGMDSEPDALGAPPSVWAPAVFRVIEWRRFEVVLEAYFAQAGFVTSAKSHGPEGGVDIWLYSRHEPGVPVSLVHGKHSHGKKVTSAQVREFMNV